MKVISGIGKKVRLTLNVHKSVETVMKIQHFITFMVLSK